MTINHSRLIHSYCTSFLLSMDVNDQVNMFFSFLVCFDPKNCLVQHQNINIDLLFLLWSMLDNRSAQKQKVITCVENIA